MSDDPDDWAFPRMKEEITRLSADLAAAREVLMRIERESVDDVSRADARAFLERTKTGGNGE